MLTSLSLIFLVGLAVGAICGYLKLPRIIGMLVTGIVLGPYVLDLLYYVSVYGACHADSVGNCF